MVRVKFLLIHGSNPEKDEVIHRCKLDAVYYLPGELVMVKEVNYRMVQKAWRIGDDGHTQYCDVRLYKWDWSHQGTP